MATIEIRTRALRAGETGPEGWRPAGQLLGRLTVEGPPSWAEEVAERLRRARDGEDEWEVRVVR